ncbi:MAG: glycine cleavage system aminomethyltransferase GcvT [Elusimicrobia bacterium]|nr:glycine cleavage system aminomethyltransferase GcvT [Elusimicrobiota bacterium]
MKETILKEVHKKLGAKFMEFAGWNMPIQYAGIKDEHLATRKSAGLFDVSHMGRFVFKGKNAVPFLQHVLTNNAAALDIGQSQYTIIPNSNGGAIDDAYLYRFFKEEYILVVNAGNKQKDWDYFKEAIKNFNDVEMVDDSENLAMISLQGPLSKKILNDVISYGTLPEPFRNRLSVVLIDNVKVLIARTGYTGEPLCFELFIDKNSVVKIWDFLIANGATSVGLGARDTLRLEAGLPLYGHELGLDSEGKEIPIFACSLSRFAVSFSPLKGDFTGKSALLKQFEALKKIINRDYSLIKDLPRLIMPVALTERGVARAGCKVFSGEKHVGYITSGTTVPYWKFEGEGLLSKITNENDMRSICLALIDSNLQEGNNLDVEIRGEKKKAVIVPYHLKSETPPYARPVLFDYVLKKDKSVTDKTKYIDKVKSLLDETVENTIWRQKECINLIPSEQTQSRMTRLLSVMDPAFRYAEYKPVKAFYDVEIFYYQGTDFISKVENLLQKEMCSFLGCSEVETRPVSGQMSNVVVFSAVVDYINRLDRGSEQRRMRSVLNNHIIKGGHLSAQPMGGLHDFVASDPRTEKPAVVNFPVLAENPYKIDVPACRELIAENKPELIIFGKSMVLHPEPVKEIREFVKDLSLNCIIMYDMAHVLGLVGPHFQEPFKEGADIVTGSTHKTFFGTQRGIIGANYKKQDMLYEFWETIKKRTFPGSVSNHHLGTLLGLLMSAYEMNYFKDEYQKKVLSNAKAFARALKDCGMNVIGDPKVSFTETHQVIINVGYAKGVEFAKKLEENNIIVNYQATLEEEGFTAAGSIRLGVSEMTRFGMKEEDFKTVAQLIYDVTVGGKPVKDKVKEFRKNFVNVNFCFSGKEFDIIIEKLHKLI